MTKSKAK